MRPLIKWPGGKSAEIPHFESMIPEYDRYIEPFAGGAALFFHLCPASAVLNDISGDLMLFYEMVGLQDPSFRRYLELYDSSFTALRALCVTREEEILTLYGIYAAADRDEKKVSGLDLCAGIARQIAADPEICTELVCDRDAFEQEMERAVEDKIRRTVKLEKKGPLSAKDLSANLRTGFCSGFYLYFRRLYNEIILGKREAGKAFRAANFYFVREYCYGSMFRYNRAGEFNIPYGGMSYNEKNLSEKIRRLFSDDVARLMGRTRLCSMDFEEFLKEADLQPNDFLFLDPPYDTDFSEYEGNVFDRRDQKRLADLLGQVPCRFLLIIRNTEFIHALYSGRGWRLETFDNRYMYNVRSRNNREAEHLIVTNVPEEEVPWIRETAERTGDQLR